VAEHWKVPWSHFLVDDDIFVDEQLSEALWWLIGA
jgi:hypothetical protein